MTGAPATSASSWARALRAAAACAVDPAGLGGVRVRARPGPARDAWCQTLRGLLAPSTPWVRLPAHATADRLLGGLDLAATLRAGRAIAERGLLAEAHGGVVLAGMAERLPRDTVAHLSAALDRGEVALERDGFSQSLPARIAVVALDEGIDDEAVAPALADRLGLHLSLEAVTRKELLAVESLTAEQVLAARARLADVEVEPEALEALCKGAFALGIGSLRAPQLALRAARASAALAGRDRVEPEDLAWASAWVIGPRARHAPPAEPPPEEEPPPPEDSRDEPDDDGAGETEPDGPLEDVVLEAAESAIPAGLLELLAEAGRRRRASAAGHSGALQDGGTRGRRIGSRPANGKPRGRVDVVGTLRAAAPWQPLRREEAKARGKTSGPRVHVRTDDIRVARYRQRTQTTTIFAVDASGSAALARLAEAKGAVERVLADCYVRRDQVALIAFRGEQAELLLPPTRSLVRAKRALAGLPGGGTTPLGAGIAAAATLARDVQGKGDTPVVVLLTDGRANVARDGTRRRDAATQDALLAARWLGELEVRTLFVDCSARPQHQARALAEAMAGRYLHLPYADSANIAAAVQAT